MRQCHSTKILQKTGERKRKSFYPVFYAATAGLQYNKFIIRIPVKRRKAGDNLFQRLKGRVIGVVANMLLEPIKIRQIGKDTMLNFGTAVLNRDATFTFPAAENLKSK